VVEYRFSRTKTITRMLLICTHGRSGHNVPLSNVAKLLTLLLSAIFALYFMYWTHLNMFETIKYLCVIAVPTFILGHQLLSSIAAKR